MAKNKKDVEEEKEVIDNEHPLIMSLDEQIRAASQALTHIEEEIQKVNAEYDKVLLIHKTFRKSRELLASQTTAELDVEPLILGEQKKMTD